MEGCLSALGQAHGRLRVGRHHRQLRTLLQMMRHGLADLRGVIATVRLKMKHHQCGQGDGIESQQKGAVHRHLLRNGSSRMVL